MMQSMVIQMNDQHLRTLAQLQAFLDGTTTVDFALAPEESGTVSSAAPCAALPTVT
jgi:hypothetical protein